MESELNNPNTLQQLYPDSILESVYWRERGSEHRKLVDKSDPAQVSRSVDIAARAILTADALLFVTGAGAGVDMGLPDFRSSTKFWEELAHPEIFRYEDSSNSNWFEKDPEFAWGLNYHQVQMYRSAPVHAGYEAMRRLASMKSEQYFCFTTNIDGVLQRAGFDESRVREVHGNIHRMQCTKYTCKDKDGVRDAWQERVELSYDTKTFRAQQPLPRCHNCGSLSRPNVWFCSDQNYVLWQRSLPITDANFAWLDRLEEDGKKVAVIEIGAGLVIPSARVEAEDVAERFSGALVRINPSDFMVPVVPGARTSAHVDGPGGVPAISCAVGVPLGSARALVAILKRVMELKGNK